MAARLQHRSAAQQPGQPVAGRLCHAQRPGIATGRDAARNRGLRAPPRCSTEPDRLKWLTDSTHPWMRNGAQVTCNAANTLGPAVGGGFTVAIDLTKRSSMRLE